ncbi:MAG: hypothetical protein WA484_04375 [Solirubrobacteraceae bacterium]
MIFDNDGLLLDTEEAWTRADRMLFARRGLEFTTEHKRSLIGSSRTTAAVKLESMLELAGEGEGVDGRAARAHPSPRPTFTRRRAGAWPPSRAHALRWRTHPPESPRPWRREYT